MYKVNGKLWGNDIITSLIWIYSYRLVKKCFLKICETSKCHNFLIFQPIFIRFSLLCLNIFTLSSEIELNLLWISSLNDVHVKVTATSLKLEIRLHAHMVGTNTRSGTEAIFMLIWLAYYVFGTRLLHSYFRSGFILVNFVSQSSRKFPLKYMASYIINKNITNITKLSHHEFPHLVQNCENICLPNIWRIQHTLHVSYFRLKRPATTVQWL